MINICHLKPPQFRYVEVCQNSVSDGAIEVLCKNVVCLQITYMKNDFGPTIEITFPPYTRLRCLENDAYTDEAGNITVKCRTGDFLVVEQGSEPREIQVLSCMTFHELYETK